MQVELSTGGAGERVWNCPTRSSSTSRSSTTDSGGTHHSACSPPSGTRFVTPQPSEIKQADRAKHKTHLSPTKPSAIHLGQPHPTLLRARLTGRGTAGRDGGQDTHDAGSKAPDLLKWGQHLGPDRGVACEVGDRLGSHASCPLRYGSLIACPAGRMLFHLAIVASRQRHLPGYPSGGKPVTVSVS